MALLRDRRGRPVSVRSAGRQRLPLGRADDQCASQATLSLSRSSPWLWLIAMRNSLLERRKFVTGVPEVTWSTACNLPSPCFAWASRLCSAVQLVHHWMVAASGAVERVSVELGMARAASHVTTFDLNMFPPPSGLAEPLRRVGRRRTGENRRR